ncbi:MAG: hypothetical protein ABIL11_02770 [Chloroflexota bacterium]
MSVSGVLSSWAATAMKFELFLEVSAHAGAARHAIDGASKKGRSDSSQGF